jgi:hypothetical protein
VDARSSCRSASTLEHSVGYGALDEQLGHA